MPFCSAPAKAFGAGAIPGQADHDGAVFVHVPGAAPAVVERACLGSMTEVLPASGLGPAGGIRSTVGADTAGDHGGPVGGNADGAVQHITEAQVLESRPAPSRCKSRRWS